MIYTYGERVTDCEREITLKVFNAAKNFEFVNDEVKEELIAVLVKHKLLQES